MRCAGEGKMLFANAERTRKGPGGMANVFGDRPEAVGRTLEIADRCSFNLEEIRYYFSEESLPPGHTPMSYLRELTFTGLHFRYPAGPPGEVLLQIERERSESTRLNSSHT